MASIQLTAEDIDVELLDDSLKDGLVRSATSLLGTMQTTKRLLEAVWPICSHGFPDKIGLKLVPLDRIGGAQGFSGSKVMVSYFFDGAKDRPLFPSRPMIVKISATAKGDLDKLRDEKSRAEKVSAFVGYHPDSFAVPLHIDDASTNDSISVLWSPFAAPWKISHPSRILFDAQREFLHLLRGEPVPSSEGNVHGVMNNVYELLKPLHKKGGMATTDLRSYNKEYESYLRGIAKEGGWGRRWSREWGEGTSPRVNTFNREWANPLWVLHQIKDKTLQMYCGAIHGDLHPRNIIMGAFGSPRVIDFGWTDESGHIAKDFVLLEANLRFMLLPPEISPEGLDQMSKLVAFREEMPVLEHQACNERIEAIWALRNIASQHFPERTDWLLEYVVPLFLTSLGLLKHIRAADNTTAAQLTVLSLATYISRNLDL
jgi:hypothetical protein